MQPGAHAGIALEQAGRHAHRLEVRRLARHQRAALGAEGAERARRRFIAADGLLAAEPAELRLVDMRVGGERGAGQLAADRAMAVGQRPHCIDLEAHAAARTAALKHSHTLRPRQESMNPDAVPQWQNTHWMEIDVYVKVN